MFGPEIVREYLEHCAVRLNGARALVEKNLGPLDVETIKKLQKTVHKLAGSTGTYGFPNAEEAAVKLERLLGSSLESAKPLSEALKAEVLCLIETMRRGLGLEE